MMDQRVLITGASRGLGRELAREAARRGHRTVLVARTAHALDELLDELETLYPNGHHHAIVMDLTHERAVTDLIEWFEQDDWPDIVFHNAGFGRFGCYADLEPEDIEGMIRVMITFPLMLTRELIPIWRERQNGRLIFIGSTSGRKPVPYMALYSATKAFIHTFAPALTEELRPYGIHVSLYILGGMSTAFHRSAGFPLSFQAGRLHPSTVARRIWWDIEHGRSGVFTIGNIKERLGGYLQRILPPQWWAARMGKHYRSLLDKRSESQD